ncbi:helix-turn-helix domain-containing protein [Candidatus Spongiihabitans sp.]|uniref:helix-turn-helix domain-containing protein n=1 Tax=Candidatus Spongiihabitans sp. TaxID=3101308 RepID=UPI003C6F8C20
MTSKHAQQRLKILGFFADHGAAATCDAFKVSRRTLYRWKQCAKPTTPRPP